MDFDKEFTTADIAEKDALVVSNDAYCIGKMLASFINELKRQSMK